MSSELAENLRRLRLERKWTQVELAKRAGTRPVRIAELERRAVTDPRLSRVVALADALEVSVDELVGRSGKSKKRA